MRADRSFCKFENLDCGVFCFGISVDGVSVAEEEKEGYAWLQEIEKPEDLAVDGAMYRGPKIVEN